MRRTKEEAQVTRQHLLEATIKIMSLKGYAGTRLEDVAEEAGVTRGAIYWHFGNKKELMIALLKERIDPYFKIIEDMTKKDMPAVKKLYSMMVQLFKKMESDQFFTAHQRFGLIEYASRDDFCEAKKCINERGEKVFYALSGMIKDGQEEGNIRKDVDPEAVALNILIFFKGYGFFLQHEEDREMFSSKRKAMIKNMLYGVLESDVNFLHD